VDLREAAALFAGSGCDGIIGLGGAVTLDLARLLGRSGAPAVAIPTGTESVGLGPLGIGFARHAGRNPLVPSAIFCDATLTLSADPETTAAAGMDALIHCLEAYLSTAYNPPADGIALDGLRRAMANLPKAVGDGLDIEARRELLAAALDGGLAAQKGFGGVEAAARGLEQEVRVRHGALHAAMLPEVLAFNAPAVAERIAIIRSALGLGARTDPVEAFCRMAEDIGLPVRLSEAGVGMAVLARAARNAAADPANQTNPRHATPRDYEAMMSAAL
jgi:alcohol dehydrogenase class IV